jgi:N-acetylglucosaminyldiphosphoundecaprenol N-acetyl-beta-D-mannosaminyltransferase
MTSALPIALMGVAFDPVDQRSALRLICQMARSPRPRYVVTANVDFLVQARRDVELRRILLEADLVLCDGTPVLWASRWFGNGLPERVAGSDLVPALVAAAETEDLHLFLLGSTPAVCEKATRRLAERYPRLRVSCYAPPFRSLLAMDHEAIASRIRDARPDILLVGMGCPKQEKWIAMNYRALNVPVSIGVGATIDFLAGQVRRAPQWMRSSGTEWLFRLAQEPGRLYKRYAGDLSGLCLGLATQWCSLRRSSGSGLTEPSGAVAGCLLLPERMDHATLRHSGLADFASPPGARPLLVDGSRVTQIDSTGLALLAHLRRGAQAAGSPLLLAGVSPILRRALQAFGWEEFFPEAAPGAVGHPVCWSAEATNRLRLQWLGEVTASNVAEVKSLTQQALEELSSGVLFLDCQALRFMDSAGLRLLLWLRQIALERQLSLLLGPLQPAVRNVIRVAGLDPAMFTTQRSADSVDSCALASPQA